MSAATADPPQAAAKVQLALYSAAVFEPDDCIEGRRLRGDEARSTWHAAHELPDLAESLTSDNADGWNVFVGVNPRKGKGQRSDDSVLLARCAFVDFDDATLEEALRRVEAAGLPRPTLVIISGHGVHCYWRLTRPVEDLAAWRELQWDLAVLLGGDVKCRNYERIMRLPGLLNVKREPAVACVVHECEAGRRVAFEALRALVKPRPPEAARPRRAFDPSAAGVGDRVKRCVAYLKKCPDAVSGNHGHDSTFRAACETVRFGLSDAEAWEVLCWFNDGKTAGEPWTDRELEHKLKDANREAGAEFGCRLEEESEKWAAPRKEADDLADAFHRDVTAGEADDESLGRYLRRLNLLKGWQWERARDRLVSVHKWEAAAIVALDDNKRRMFGEMKRAERARANGDGQTEPAPSDEVLDAPPVSPPPEAATRPPLTADPDNNNHSASNHNGNGHAGANGQADGKSNGAGGPRRSPADVFKTQPKEVVPVIPLDQARPPKMPEGVFTRWMGDMVDAVSRATETPPELAAGFGMGALSVASQKTFSVSPEPGYFEPALLWPIPVLESGSRKTAVFKMMTAPLGEWEDIRAAELLPKIEEAKSRRKTVEGRINELRKQAAKAPDRESHEKLAKEVAELEQSLEPIPVLPILSTEDCTSEHLGTLMAEQGEKMALLSDEGGPFEFGGRYAANGAPSLDLYLKSHSESPVRVHRGSRPAVLLRHPALTFCVSPQPDVMCGLAKKPGFAGRGVLARGLYLMPESNVGFRRNAGEPVPDDVAGAYRDSILSLLDTPPRTDAGGTRSIPYVLTFDRDARRCGNRFRPRSRSCSAPGAGWG